MAQPRPPHRRPILRRFWSSSNITVNAIAVASGDTNSSVTTKAFAPNIPSGTLVWSDEFANSGTTPAQPNPAIWTYDIGTRLLRQQ
jgi:uncharacterized membrane protein YfbV (UPF0208 family)